MPLPLKTGFPHVITIGAGYQIVFQALDPTTGNAVTGVTVSNVSVFGDDGRDITSELLGPFMFVPGQPQTAP